MLHALLSPLGAGLCLAVLRVLVRRRRVAARVLDAGIAFCLLLATPLGANALVKLVESRLPADDCRAQPADAIVVLSAGFRRAPRDDEDFGALVPAGIDRTSAGIAAWKSEPSLPLAILGGGPFRIPESDVLGRFAQRLGVPATSIVAERRSRTTWENARELRALMPALRRVRVVSSPLHLPRALIAFRAAGFEPCPLPGASDYVAPDGVGYFLPQSSALAKSEAALHEIVGMLVYALRASTSS